MVFDYYLEIRVPKGGDRRDSARSLHEARWAGLKIVFALR